MPQFHALVVVNTIIEDFKPVILALVEDMRHDLVFSRAWTYFLFLHWQCAVFVMSGAIR
ncbi:hypothetical protein GNF11_06420 [Nostoc sp. UCD122]|uniref:hypothetical protein n=1 Tax=Nostoc sp. UCD120 TaxID=2681312 RepID=UPI001623DEF7|nr:hypothetical protein [Nostoc sp. UCD120]MBC1218779.1 hypothetical protein [Nostoc sp. UCD120]MBC1294630.1 hypothetical protein [Nostoc sp. UCD122]